MGLPFLLLTSSGWGWSSQGVKVEVEDVAVQGSPVSFFSFLEASTTLSVLLDSAVLPLFGVLFK
jgi:hypothetical protein